MIRIKMGGYVDENGNIMTKQELDAYITKIQDENSRYRAALEFYADRDSWNFLEEDQSVLIISECDSEIIIINNHGDKYPFGGRRAREALKGGE